MRVESDGSYSDVIETDCWEVQIDKESEFVTLIIYAGGKVLRKWEVKKGLRGIDTLTNALRGATKTTIIFYLWDKTLKVERNT